jgi:tetratricopeptide (TPR) repeat protein/SAM-dependent methyltransferase
MIANLFAAAVALHQKGAIADAERRYREVLALAPDHSDSLHNLGLIALSQGNAAAAAELIAQAIAANDRKAEYHYNIALAYRALGRLDDVAAHLQRAIGIRGDYAPAHLNLGNVRREQGRPAEAMACYERALALSPQSAAARFNLANMLTEQRRYDAAIANYRQGLALEPNHAEAHSGLGVALAGQGKPREAVPHLERALALKPDLVGVYEELANAYMSAGDVSSAVRAASRGLEVNETAAGKTLFAQCVTFANFTSDSDGRYRKLVQRALVESWTVPCELSGVCISLIKLDERVRDMIARAAAAWPARLPELFDTDGLAALGKDELLHRLLECGPVTDIGFERLLTNLRQAMLTGGTKAAADQQHLDLYCAVARQCFVNEYVFSTLDEELDQARQARASLDQALASDAPIAPILPVVVGAYFPLHTLANAQKLLERSWPGPVKALLVQQIEEPAEELRTRTGLPAITEIEDQVSQVVRAQYEENPYPRWVKGGPPAQPLILDHRPAPISDVLIAGCGTGMFTTGFARRTPQARFLAIDLSLASLAYAKRMANSLGLTNIEFAQADIMRLGAIDRSFDFIDASGVLHHMADPWGGWRVLLSLLRPGGIMQIGLYSELARQGVVAARALIAERGFRPVPEDIRRLREIIAAAEDGSPLKQISQWSDFFTTSECRDLLFHPQERRTSLPEIKSFLAANDLQFAGFILDALTSDRFARRFPELTNLTGKARFDGFADLDRWHVFETEFPETFASMYRFWVHKSGASPAHVPEE